MNYKKMELKKGINIHNIKTNKFKTNLYAVFLAVPLNRKDITKNALITAILRRGTNNLKTQEIINKKLEEMYGASFNCGIEKTGDNQIIKFYLEALNEQFLPKQEELTKECINLLFEVIFNPLVEENSFNNEYVESEKKNLKQIIESKIDNKRAYSFERCIEEMFKNEPYGLYKYGYVEDLNDITAKDLYEHYLELIKRCKIDIFVSGEIDDDIVQKIIEDNSEIKKLNPREPEYVINKDELEKKVLNEPKVIEEHLNVGQGNLVIGLNINSEQENAKFIASVYNAILGGGANSKLFQNVREKNSLAYTAGSTYKKQKNILFIRCGIEINNYDKALVTIKEQLEDIRKGKFDEKDIENAKTLIIESIRSIDSEQDSEIIYYYGQELSDKFVSMDEYINKINMVNKEDIEKIAKDVYINTIYFLRD